MTHRTGKQKENYALAININLLLTRRTYIHANDIVAKLDKTFSWPIERQGYRETVPITITSNLLLRPQLQISNRHSSTSLTSSLHLVLSRP